MLACLSMHTLLPNLLRGIYSRYSTAADIIAGTAGMTFSTVLDQLKLKELRLENEVKVEATNALVASSSGCSGSDCRSSSSKPPQQQPQQGNDGGGNSGDGQQRRKKGNGGRRNDDGNDPQFRPPPPPPADLWICINPQALQGALGSGDNGGGQWRGGQGILGPPP
jgi:hypothetical protein